ncbi:MAG: PTS sugar transporter subunit IIB [Treponema sp.]|jgi:PTS system cellobiose-specific IIB component|nr:PTS sugar transporter subunit IIB [Treponema sp.]
MKNIVLVCTTGVSTTMLVKNMRTAVEKRGLDLWINAVSEVHLTKSIEKADAVLLGPQVRYLLEKIKVLAPGKPVQVIDMQDYGMMNGENVINTALGLLGEEIKRCGVL